MCITNDLLILEGDGNLCKSMLQDICKYGIKILKNCTSIDFLPAALNDGQFEKA